MEGEGFEPSKAEPSDLQSDPFDRSGTPPNETADYEYIAQISQSRIGLNPQYMGDKLAILDNRIMKRINNVSNHQRNHLKLY